MELKQENPLLLKSGNMHARPCIVCEMDFTPEKKTTVVLCSNRCRAERRRRRRGVKPLPSHVIKDGKKMCSECFQWKDLADFGIRPERGNRPRSACNECLKSKAIKYNASDAALNSAYIRKYNVDLEWYDKIFKRQNGSCAICETPGPSRGSERLVIDHCHRVGKPRGLLCRACNTAIGKLGDDTQGILRALNYLLNPIVD